MLRRQCNQFEALPHDEDDEKGQGGGWGGRRGVQTRGGDRGEGEKQQSQDRGIHKVKTD